MNEEEKKEMTRNVEAMKATPIILNALIEYLKDKGIIDEKTLLDYIDKDNRVKKQKA